MISFDRQGYFRGNFLGGIELKTQLFYKVFAIRHDVCLGRRKIEDERSE